MSLFFWVIILLASIWATHWGADKLAEPLQKLRRQWGLTEVAGAALIALATASPEMGTNAVSAWQGVSEIGLGNLLGSNIISVPVIVTVAYFAEQYRSGKPNLLNSEDNSLSLSPLSLKPEALPVQAIPYLAVIFLVAILTLPPPWQGLQPIDGWIMLCVYVAYLCYAIGHKRQTGSDVEWKSQEAIVSIMGVLVLILGAYFIVAATEHLVELLSISQLIGGLFITSTLSIVPEVLATWSIARSGQVTAATTSVIADNTVTMTLAFFPLAVVSLPIEDLKIYTINLAFISLLGLAYAAFIYWGRPKNSFSFLEIIGLNSIYLIYLVVMFQVVF